MTPGRTDTVWATVAGLAALSVYVATLAPGLVVEVDAPMFQFIGRVLGVPHNPGYPLYVLVTHVFSYLPIGSLAYRINLFSGILGALTVSLAFLIGRRLGCRRIVCLGASLGMAFGHIFWSQSVIAEVYTLHTAILAAVLLTLLTWGETGRSRLFYASVALFAAGLGNHITIVGFAPGIALYALLTHRPFVLRARTVLTVAAILFLGLLQYGFILVRSRQSGVYLESRAETLAELFDVMRAAQFSDRLFAFDWRSLLFERLPWVVQRVLTPELTLAGLVLSGVGSIWLLRYRRAAALLLLFGCLATIVFAINYSVVDTPVFLLPATFVLWLLAGVGCERAAVLVGRKPWLSAAAAAFVLGLPAWHLSHNFRMTDRSRDTEAAAHLDSLFKALPERSVLVHEDFLVDRLVMFKLLGEGVEERRRIELAPRDPGTIRRRLAEKYQVFAFQKSVRQLRYDGLDFAFRPMALTDRPLSEFLPALPDGTVVALSVPAQHAERLRSSGMSLDAIGGDSEIGLFTSGNVAIVGVRGARRGSVVRSSRTALTARIEPGREMGKTGVHAVSAIEIQADGSEAAIRQGSRDIARSSDGVAMALWRPDGRLDRAFILEPDHGYRVPIPTSALSVYPLRGLMAAHELHPDRWSDLKAAVTSGTTMLRVPPGAVAMLCVSDDGPLAPRVIQRSSDRASVEIARVEAMDALQTEPGMDDETLAALARTPFVYTIRVAASGTQAVSVMLAFGGVPAQAIGRTVETASSAVASAIRIDTDGLLRTVDRRSEVLLMARDDQAQLTGSGWSAVDSDAVSVYRWMTDREARLLLPIASADVSRIRIQALCEDDRGPSTMSLRLNGTALPPVRLMTGWQTYEWTVPAGVPRQGINESAVIVDGAPTPSTGGGAPKRIAVSEVRIVYPSKR